MTTSSHDQPWLRAILLACVTTLAGGCGSDQTSPPPPTVPILDIAFLQAGNIYRIRASGQGIVNLTNSVGVSGVPDWSPDGLLIVFSSTRDGMDPVTGNAGVYTMKPDGSAVTRVMLGDGAAWSRDGRLAVNQEGTDANTYLLVVANADGSQSDTVTIAATPLIEQSWSPDGARLVYRREAGIMGGINGNLEVRNADGSGGLVDLGAGYNPSWSPDGTKILFDDAGLYLMNPDGSGRTQIRATGYDPIWSPDGKYIAFMDRDANGQADVHIMKADGTDDLQVTNSPELEAGPSVGPAQ